MREEQIKETQDTNIHYWLLRQKAILENTKHWAQYKTYQLIRCQSAKMKYNHKSETLVGFYLRLAVARQMRIRYQHQCVPAVWSLWRCALYWGALTVHTNIHAQGFSPPGLWCQCAFTLWEGLWLWIQAGGELALTSSSPNFTKCDSHEERIWRASKNWGWKVIRGKTLLRRIAWWWIFSGHLLSLFFCPFKYMQTCKWVYGSETEAGGGQTFTFFDCR